MRMFVEGDVEVNESPRMAANRLMRALDDEALLNPVHMVGDVTMTEYEQAFSQKHTLRLEAEVRA